MSAFDTKPREGSMAAADAKTEKWVLRVFSFITLLLLFLLFINNGTFFAHYADNAGFLPNILGAILLIAAPVFLWYGMRQQWTGMAIWGLYILLTALGFLVSCGFNFNLPAGS
jgi:hypothetical protein